MKEIEVCEFVPVRTWDDIKVGAFYIERGAYRKVLAKDKGICVVSYHVDMHRIDINDKKSFLEPEEFKAPLWRWNLEDFTMFAGSRVTFKKVQVEDEDDNAQ